MCTNVVPSKLYKLRINKILNYFRSLLHVSDCLPIWLKLLYFFKIFGHCTKIAPQGIYSDVRFIPKSELSLMLAHMTWAFASDTY